MFEARLDYRSSPQSEYICELVSKHHEPKPHAKRGSRNAKTWHLFCESHAKKNQRS